MIWIEIHFFLQLIRKWIIWLWIDFKCAKKTKHFWIPQSSAFLKDSRKSLFTPSIMLYMVYSRFVAALVHNKANSHTWPQRITILTYAVNNGRSVFSLAKNLRLGPDFWVAKKNPQHLHGKQTSYKLIPVKNKFVQEVVYSSTQYGKDIFLSPGITPAPLTKLSCDAGSPDWPPVRTTMWFWLYFIEKIKDFSRYASVFVYDW